MPSEPPLRDKLGGHCGLHCQTNGWKLGCVTCSRCARQRCRSPAHHAARTLSGRPGRSGNSSAVISPGRLSSRMSSPSCRWAIASASARPRPAPSAERLEFQAAEAPPRFAPELARDSRAAIGDLDPDLLAGPSTRDPDVAALRAVADGILDEVADRLREQLAMAEQRHRPGRRIISRSPRRLLRRAARTFRRARRRVRRGRTRRTGCGRSALRTG